MPCTIDLGIPVFGRQSCADPANPPLRNFLEGDSLDSIQFLSSSFGLTDVEVIALLGGSFLNSLINHVILFITSNTN